MRVLRFVPLHRQCTCHWHFPSQELQSIFPVAHVGKNHDPIACHVQHFCEQAIRSFDGLQGLGHDHIVKSMVPEVRGQSVIQIALDDVQQAARPASGSLSIQTQVVNGDLAAGVGSQARQETVVVSVVPGGSGQDANVAFLTK